MELELFCKRCNISIGEVGKNTKYCAECRKVVRREATKRHKDKAKVDNRKINEKKYNDNFWNVIKCGGFTLTPKGFNSVSKIRVKSYTQFFDTDWISVLRHYNKYHDLVDYLVKEYKSYYYSTCLTGYQSFTKQHEYISYDFIYTFNFNDILSAAMNKIGVSKKPSKYSLEDLRDNFINVKNNFGRIPLYQQIVNVSDIKIETYASRLKLKGKVYDNIVKLYATDKEYNEYLEHRRVHKSNLGKETGILSNRLIPDDDLEAEFKRVVDYCLKIYKSHPSRRLFNKLSKYDDSVYRGRFKMSWLDICSHYGYSVDKNHKSEKIVLESIKNITGIKYIPQKTWKWLIGHGGKNMYCDGYFEEINLVVEFDGRQHRMPVDAFGGIEKFKRIQQNDKLKEELLAAHNIQLIRIDSREPWHDIGYLARKLFDNGISIKKEYLKEMTSIA